MVALMKIHSRVRMTTKATLVALAILNLSTSYQCAAQQKAGATDSAIAEAADPLFREPYIDVDEWRDKPVRHRYVHGGFKGTEARFSFYFPSKEQYQGRFFQYISPFPTSENLDQQNVGEEDKIVAMPRTNKPVRNTMRGTRRRLKQIEASLNIRQNSNGSSRRWARFGSERFNLHV